MREFTIVFPYFLRRVKLEFVPIPSFLGRALSLPESLSKHQRIQALVTLMSTMIESCPSPPQSHSSQPPFKNPNSTSMNNVIRLMLKKGVITDLARVSYSLDLSSPHMANTVNATLKPLETLSRIVNQPQVYPLRVSEFQFDLLIKYFDELLEINIFLLLADNTSTGIALLFVSTGSARRSNGRRQFIVNCSRLKPRASDYYRPNATHESNRLETYLFDGLCVVCGHLWCQLL